MLAADDAEEQSVLDIAGTAAEGLSFFAPEPLVASAEARSFQDRFVKRLGYRPPTLSANAYDSTRLTAPALVECKCEPECARNTMAIVQGYAGVGGNFSINNGKTDRDFVLKHVQVGTFVRAAS